MPGPRGGAVFQNGNRIYPIDAQLRTHLRCNISDTDRGASLRAMLCILSDELRIRNTPQAMSKLSGSNEESSEFAQYGARNIRGSKERTRFQSQVETEATDNRDRTRRSRVATRSTRAGSVLTATVKNFNRRRRRYSARTRPCILGRLLNRWRSLFDVRHERRFNGRLSA